MTANAYVVHADERLTAFLELERVTRLVARRLCPDGRHGVAVGRDRTRRGTDDRPAAIYPSRARERGLVRREVWKHLRRAVKPGQPEDSLVNDAQADGAAEIVDRERLRVPAHAEWAHAGGGLPDERDWREWRGSVGDADDGESIVYAEGLAARASERLEVDLYAVVPP